MFVRCIKYMNTKIENVTSAALVVTRINMITSHEQRKKGNSYIFLLSKVSPGVFQVIMGCRKRE